MDQTENNVLQLRDPQQVMRLARLGSFHQTRLSFMRVLLRRLHRQNWQFSRTQWVVDHRGQGIGVYTARGPVRTYSLVVFAHELDPAKRSDRVIAEAWDATFTLFDGVPAQDDLDRLAANVPLQEAGRISEKELTLSRANRSVRLFDSVRTSLAGGRQPDRAELDAVGYLMRTTAVYGSGKFGAIDHRFIADRDEFSEPFQAELLTVYMIREFSIDIVEHLARCDNPEQFTPLAPALRRRLGIGNSTGLGMAPFVVNHPTLLNNWILARETALAKVRALDQIESDEQSRFTCYLKRQIINADDWQTDHDLQAEKLKRLRHDLQLLQRRTETTRWHSEKKPWDALYCWAEKSLSLEGQECLVTLMLELYPVLVDDMASSMSTDESLHFRINGRMSLQNLQRLLKSNYHFSTAYNSESAHENTQFWYVSEDKLEPRLGDRFKEPGAALEQPLAIARDVARLQADLDSVNNAQVTVTDFLRRHPEHRHTVRRVQQSEAHPYSEISENLISAEMLPIDLLRCKLSFFGAVKFDPRSDRWVRITLYQHAPTIAEIGALKSSKGNDYDDWIYPALMQADA